MWLMAKLEAVSVCRVPGVRGVLGCSLLRLYHLSIPSVWQALTYVLRVLSVWQWEMWGQVKWG